MVGPVVDGTLPDRRNAKAIVVCHATNMVLHRMFLVPYSRGVCSPVGESWGRRGWWAGLAIRFQPPRPSDILSLRFPSLQKPVRDYAITQGETGILGRPFRVRKLQELTKRICEEKIASMACADGDHSPLFPIVFAASLIGALRMFGDAAKVREEPCSHAIRFEGPSPDAVKIGFTRFLGSQSVLGRLHDFLDLFRKKPGIGLLRLFLIICVFDMISLFVAQRSCRFTFGNKPTPIRAKPVPFVATSFATCHDSDLSQQ
jgi:hypothetical protein